MGGTLQNLPHDWIGIAAAFLAVAIFAYIGIRMALRMWKDYEQRYLAGTATTLDAMYIAMPAQNILYLSLLCALLVAGAVAIATGSLIGGAILAAPAFAAPRVILWYLKRRRDDLFGIQLVDALMNISSGLRAGFSLPQALEMIHREMPNPISQEFRLVCQELRLGVLMEDELANLHKRMPLPDVDLMVTAIVIVRDVGGNLSEVFDNIAHTIRERHRIEGKINALTAQGRLQAVVVSLIPIFIAGALLVVAPDFFQPMLTTAVGWLLIAAILVLEIIGALWIRRIVRIDV